MKSKGYTIPELLVVMTVVGIALIVFLSSTVYAFDNNNESYYDDIISLILIQARNYGEQSTTLQEEQAEIISIDELIELEYLIGDENGEIKDPRNENKTLNDIDILLKYNSQNEVVATIEKE